MKRTAALLIVTVFALVLTPPQTATLAQPALAGPGEVAIVVTSAADSGPGTLRQALMGAQGGDTITFDSVIFPPTAPVTISLTSELPGFDAGNLTLDASNAGVILDGSHVPGDWVAGLQIASSDGNIIRGLQISNFSGRAIDISGDSQHNVIGGDRSVGAGPSGQGNMLTRNGTGVVMSTPGTMLNSLTGNLIGTDATGTGALGNGIGMWICEGANDNTIGPDNVIAYNYGSGIVVAESNSVENTITQNSIHDNGGMGIRLLEGANRNLAIPVILDYDLSAGTLTGVTCDNCTVEVFSEEDDEGAVYESRATADGHGVFAVQHSTSFAGPHLTATTTDPNGNTSPFSVPVSGTVRSLVLQQGNDLRTLPFRSRCTSDLSDNRIGSTWGYLESPHMEGDFACDPQGARGLMRVRLSFNEMEDWPYIDWSRPEVPITAEQDAFIDRLVESGITVTYILNFWDKANHPDGWPEIPSRFTTQEEIDRYLEYIRYIIGHFQGRVQHFELWNEPDNDSSAIQHIKPQDYVDMVRQVVPIIKDEFPEVKIFVGDLILFNPYARAYMAYLVQSDVMSLVDGLAWHPFYGTAPDVEEERQYYYAYPGLVRQIQETAIAHGFQGEFRGDEIGWCSPDEPVPETCRHMYTNAVAAKYYDRGIILHLGLDVAVHVGSPGEPRLQTSAVVGNLCTVFAGSEAQAFPLQVQTTVTNVVSYTFSLPYDDRMIALWTDGIALDFDPGITATVTLPGLAGHQVTAIDPLFSYQQPIIADVVGGDLVIHDLLVKDYPIILRLRSIRRVYLPILQKEYVP
ncbi:MAG: right-handed parallel beta-helix repeat-containing protein [Anaerolineae bacterium]